MKPFAALCVMPFALLLLTGCPSNEYTVDLTPRGEAIERKLLFYCEDGLDTNGATKYLNFPPAELAQITRLYPTSSLTRDGLRYTVTGIFGGGRMPSDVGGSGSYTNVTTTLGSAGVYLERFRGDDDLATCTAKRLHAADQLTDYIIGWSRMELGREHGYEHLRRFLDTDFRRDMKNLSLYAGMLQASSAAQAKAPEEFAVRFGQYLTERGYLKVEDLPELFHAYTDDDPRPVMKKIQHLVASKLGVPQNGPMPPSLAFLLDANRLEKSWEKYLMTTDAYAIAWRHWQKEKIVHEVKVAGKRVQGLYDPLYRTNSLPAAPEKPSPLVATDEPLNEWLSPIAFLDTGRDDHVTVRLSLPSAPTHSNGQWDEARKQVVWESNLKDADNKNGLVPAFCYASWSEPDEAAQKQHFGRVLLSGDELSLYCLWRGGLDKKEADEWDALVAGLQPGGEGKGKIEAFRFASEATQRAGTSDFVRKLLLEALEKAPGAQTSSAR